MSTPVMSFVNSLVNNNIPPGVGFFIGGQSTSAGIIGEIDNACTVGSQYNSTAGKIFIKMSNTIPPSNTDWQDLSSGSSGGNIQSLDVLPLIGTNGQLVYLNDGSNKSYLWEDGVWLDTTFLSDYNFLGNAALGAEWTKLEISPSFDFVRDSGLAVDSYNLSGFAEELEFWTGSNLPPDQVAKITISDILPVIWNNNQLAIGAGVRVSLPNNGYFIGAYKGYVALWRVDGTKLIDGNFPSIDLGAVLSLEIRGTNLVVKVNDTEVLTAIDAAYNSGQPAVYCEIDGGVDNHFVIASRWQAGAL